MLETWLNLRCYLPIYIPYTSSNTESTSNNIQFELIKSHSFKYLGRIRAKISLTYSKFVVLYSLGWCKKLRLKILMHVYLCNGQPNLVVDLGSISGLQGDVYGSGGRGTVPAVQGLLRSQHQWTPGRLFNEFLFLPMKSYLCSNLLLIIIILNSH